MTEYLEYWYCGSVTVGTGKKWEFCLENPHDLSSFSLDRHCITFGSISCENRKLTIEPILRHFSRGYTCYGYMISEGGNCIGAMTADGKGKVWICNRIDDETKFIVANVATALLL
ncbi:MAG: hypothetical protein JW795_19785 [Chitinivibrionales bacterium]|nr:hypothetical protein [Chitinivibrionales bacterium]